MSGNLCRCGAHNGIVAAITQTYAPEAARMIAVHLCPCRRRRGCAAPGRRDRRQVSRRRHQPGRPDARDDRAARRAGRRHRPAERDRGDAGRRRADRRGRPQHRGRGAPGGARRATRCWPARIVAGASAQIRNMATVGGNLLQRTRCAYFYDARRVALQQARARARAATRSAASTASHAILGTSTACVATHPSDMCVALAALDAVVHLRQRGRASARVPLTELHRLPGRASRDRDGARARRADHRGRAARAAVRRALDLSQGARPGELCVRARLGRGRAGAGGRHRPGCAARARRRRAPSRGAPGRPRTRSGAGRPRRTASARRPRRSSPRPAPLRDNAFKVELGARTISAVLDELTGGEA